MLKILAGQARGRQLKPGPKSPHLRPILARVKKSLFDILTPRLLNCRFLDLYAGTGAVGIEALSRGAEFASFVENDRRSFKLLKANLDDLKFSDKAQLHWASATAKLTNLPKPYDIVFMGPPYKDDQKKPLALVTPTLAAVAGAKLLENDAVVVAQHHKKETFELPSDTWSVYRQERYGDTMLSFIREI